METPGGEQACHIRNSYHLTPIEIAERANHTRLANTLKSHMVRGTFIQNFSFLSPPYFLAVKKKRLKMLPILPIKILFYTMSLIMSFLFPQQMTELAGMYNYLKGMTTENLRSTNLVTFFQP